MASVTIATGLAHSSAVQLGTSSKTHIHYMTVDSLNKLLVDNIPDGAKITKATLKVVCRYTLPNAILDSVYANITLYAKFCNEGNYSSGTTLLTVDKIAEDNNGTYTADITAHINPNSRLCSTQYNCFYVYSTTSNVMVRNYYCPNIDLIVEYEMITHKITTEASPAEGGTVEGGGTYNLYSTATLIATPASGYKFVEWSGGVTTPTINVRVTADVTITAYFEKNSYTVTFKNYDDTVISTQTVTGGGSATAPANPTRNHDASYHYVFAGWDKSFSNITADTVIKATYNAVAHSYTFTPTAEGRRKHICTCGYSYIERAYDIGYENLFSFADWAETGCAKGSGSGSGSVAYSITNGTVTLSGSGDFYTAYGGGSGYYQIPVTAGVEYIFRYDVTSTGGKQAFVFFYNDSGNGITGAIHNGVAQSAPHIGKYDGSHIVFTVPNGCTKVGIRVGITGTAEATYSNIAIYKTSLAAALNEITNRQYRKVFFIGEAVGTLYTPVREGYTFKGWYLGENGTGSQVTASGKLSESTTVYALWLLEAINNILVNKARPKEIYFDENNIVFVVDGDIPTLEASLYDTVNGHHIKVQNTAPSGMTKCKTVYRDLVKVYG